MKDENEVSDLAEFVESTPKLAEKFCGNGCRILTHCPLCLREFLTVEEARLLAEAFASAENYELVEAFADARDMALMILVPRKPEKAQLLDHRLVLAPICRDHSEIDGADLEKRVLLISRYGKKVKEGRL